MTEIESLTYLGLGLIIAIVIILFLLMKGEVK